MQLIYIRICQQGTTAGKACWICPGVGLGEEGGREEGSTALSLLEVLQFMGKEQRSGRQLGDLAGKALRAIDKS